MNNPPRHQPAHRTHRTLSRRNILGAGLTVAALGAGGALIGPASASGGGSRTKNVTGSTSTTATATSTAPSPFVAYSSTSYFRSSVSGTSIDATRTAAFRSFMKSHPDQRSFPYPRINGTDTNRWGTAFALGTSTDPVWKLTGSVNKFCSCLTSTGFHAPEWLSTILTGTSDSPFCVVDQASGFTVFGTKARLVAPRTISVSSAGITYHSSNGLHRDNPLTNDRRNFTSRGRISEAMVIRSDLVRFGIANDTDLGHVLHLFLCETRSSDGYRNPMVGCEGGKYGFGAEGERIAIDPSVDLTRRGLSPAGLVVARTLQNHGCYFGDNAGSASALKAEQESDTHPVWNKLIGRDSLAGVSWDDFVVLGR
jgi:hypothetical protein